MEKSRRSFLIKGVTGAMLMATPEYSESQRNGYGQAESG